MKINTAIPLMTVDPYFSIWSCTQNLHEDTTRHWTGKAAPILAAVYHNRRLYCLAGMQQENKLPIKTVRQTNLKVTPLSTEYTFENHVFKAVLTFTTPLLLDRLDIMSRPVSYVKYDITMKEEAVDDTRFLFGINGRSCVNNDQQQVIFKRSTVSSCVGNAHQTPLSQSGDACTCEWGYFHIADPAAKVGFFRNNQINYGAINQAYDGQNDMPYLISETRNLNGVITLGLDEIYAIEYFGKQIKEPFFEQFASFEEMLEAAKNQYTEIKALCDEFDDTFIKETKNFSEEHQAILTLAYRQAISAHKLIKDELGNWIFLSKENSSNGCIGTLDVTYPSIPLFLRYNPELVAGMLRPILRFAETEAWIYPFCPHDVGQYPLANGQVYGIDRAHPENFQMPVEECGNMLTCLAALKKYQNNDISLYEQYKNTLKQWADYLVQFGYDPENQLCTDDFAGHLNHNCNLSVKAIVGIASYALLSGDSSYMEIAREYARKWENDARNEKASRLVFDDEAGWSIKYNMVWDNLLDLHLFSEEVKAREVALYKEKCNRYGVPLDSREEYTKLDWLMWSTCLTEDKEYFDLINHCILNMIEETQDHVPLTDWYDTVYADYCYFKARSVVGGLFIHLLKTYH